MTAAILNLLEGANENQKKAILHTEGPCYVTAGPGSGKTFTVVRRTANMIAGGIDARHICLFTFTNKAAREIRERVVAYIGDTAKQITVGTYHSVCCKVLRVHAKAIGFDNNFSILDSDESLKILKKYAKAYEVEHKDALNNMADWKKKLVSPSQALTNAENDFKRRCANVYQAYEDELKRNNAMDFDNLIINTIRILENHPDIKKKINSQWRYIVADESHDSSIVDLKLISLLAGDEENVCMIMDPDQSIYGFRGASIESVMQYRYAFNKEVSIFNLAENYRCSQTIVNASKQLIARNPILLKEKFVTPARDFKGAPIIHKSCTYPKDEAISIANFITLMKKRGEKYKDMAILYRTQTAAKEIEQALLAKGIPYKLIGGHAFMARAEVKDILAYARLVVNPKDVVAFKRAISVPKRGIGEKSVEKIEFLSLGEEIMPIPIMDAAKQITFKGKTAKSLKEFTDLIDELEEHKLTLNPDDFLSKIIERIDYTNYLMSSHTNEEAKAKIENLSKLIELAGTYANIEELLANASLDQEISSEEEPDCVQLLTMHASKGLEYNVVMIAGCIEGMTPHFRSIGIPSAVEEERRLFYVALTRAKNQVFLTSTKKQMVNRQYINAIPSRFLTDLKGFIHDM